MVKLRDLLPAIKTQARLESITATLANPKRTSSQISSAIFALCSLPDGVPNFQRLLDAGTVHALVSAMRVDGQSLDFLCQRDLDRASLFTLFYIPGFQDLLVPLVDKREESVFYMLWVMSDKQELTVPICMVPDLLKTLCVVVNGPPHSFEVLATLSVLRNLTMFPESSAEMLRCVDRAYLLNVLMTLQHSDLEAVATKAVMAIANLVGKDESGNALLAFSPVMLENVTKILKNVMEGTVMRETYALYEPLTSLSYLSLPQKNRELLKPLLLHMLPEVLERATKEEVCRTEAVSNALRICSQFAFEQDCLMWFQNESPLQEVVERILQGGEEVAPSVAHEAEGLLWTLRGEEKQDLPIQVVSSSKQIMISYSWAQKDIALRVTAFFRMHGFKVWQDVDHMKQNIMESMAQGVLESTAILILVSANYKESANCQREANYAAKRGKKIIPLIVVDGYTGEGWLELFIAPLLYYDITRTFDPVLQQVITNEFNQVVTASAVAATSKADTMTVEDVALYFEQNQPELVGLSTILRKEKVDGKTAAQLVRSWNNGQLSLNEVKQWFAIDTVQELFAFKQAMEDLVT